MLHAPQVTFWCCLVIIACVGLPGTQYSLCMCAVLRMDPKSVTQYGRPLGNGETTHLGETGARNVQVKGHEHGLVRKEKTFMHMMDVWIQLRTRHLRTRGPLRTRQGRCAETEEIGLELITAAKLVHKFSRESPYISNTF
mmetsp:Transcript_62201/g.91189  ORF Transcript_62201/g.91189 Transcript_62201/m.91189 type:complete len:140 (+) Transcript_62201:273-692(+)